MHRMMRLFPSRTVLIAVVVSLLVGGVGSATAARLITGKQIKNGSIQFGDLSKKARKKLRGKRGTTGPRGSQGGKGDKGDIGPSNAFEAVNTNFVTLTGTSDATANSIATLGSLPAGDYLVIARVQANTSGTNIARVICRATLGGKSADGIVQIGSDPNGVGQAGITIALNGTLAAAGSANVKCWRESLTGTAPFTSDTYLEALKVGSATSQSVTS